MKSGQLSLHMSRERTLFFIASFSLISFVCCLLFLFVTRASLGQLCSLLSSSYSYSGTIERVPEENEYYLFDADISFLLSTGADYSLNINVAMQSEDSDYTDLVYWNTLKLNKNEIAISKSLSDLYGLKVGDTLLSKHIVDGTVREYQIKQILPLVVYLQVLNNRGYSDGIVIMGFDSDYVKNIANKTLVYTSKSVDDLFAETKGTLSNIVYREDEVALMIKEVAPYYVGLIVLSLLLVLIFSLWGYKTVLSNYRRLMIAGFGKKALDKSVGNCILIKGLSSVLISVVLTMGMAWILKMDEPVVLAMILIAIIEVGAFLGSVSYIRKRLWRL